MKKGNRPLFEIGVIESQVRDIKLDHVFYFSENGSKLPEEFLAVCSVLPAQVLSFFPLGSFRTSARFTIGFRRNYPRGRRC